MKAKAIATTIPTVMITVMNTGTPMIILMVITTIMITTTAMTTGTATTSTLAKALPVSKCRA